MSGNKRQQQQQQQNKKSIITPSSTAYAVLNMFKTKRVSSRKVEDSSWDDSMRYYKVWPSDEDRGRYVAEPGIDRKASAYIARIRAATSAEA
ncbi:hypothetical protein Vadar_018389 [Vaccinium darrowii]|uniref:Uncharacterized protein n=1 Tax=Vaccinium darrowii TaxID=229202 RepID=A0ACB7X2A5_9ERIC|nr:hypothetical protein Vadar_018389 [Vaccinium darrowii]